MPSTSCHRRNLGSWRILLLVVILASAGFCRSELSIGSFEARPTSMGSSNPPRKSLTQEIGSPSELAWQAWLLVDSQQGVHPGMDSASLVRRITPKSIFIAPPICSNGGSDKNKNCGMKDINIDPEAHQKFLTAQLNAMYGKGGSREGLLGALNRRKPESASGPLQFNIPLLPVQPLADPSPFKIDLGHKGSPPDSVLPPRPLPEIKHEIAPSLFNTPLGSRFELGNKQENLNKKDEAVIIIENTTSQQFKPDNTQTPPFNGQVLSVAEIAVDLNNSFVGVVDYKIPDNSKPIINHTGLQNERPLEVVNTNKNFFPDKRIPKPEASTFPPTLVLLVTPPKVRPVTTTEASTEPDIVHNSSIDPIIVLDNNQDENATEDANLSDEFYIPTVTSLDDFRTDTTDGSSKIDDDDINGDLDYPQHSKTTNEKHDDVIVYGDEESEIEPSSDRDEYEETTDTTDQEDFADPEDEILKPGEAGMAIPKENQEMVQSDKINRELNKVMNNTWQTSTVATDATTLYTDAGVTSNTDSKTSFDFNATTVEDDYEHITTTDSFEDVTNTDTSELTITQDTSTETVLPYTSPSDSTRSPIIINSTSIANYTSFNDTQEAFEAVIKDIYELQKELNPEPEVILSTKEDSEVSSPSTNNKKRVDQLTEEPITPSLKENIDESSERTPTQVIEFFPREPPLWIRQKVTTQVDEDRQASTMNERVVPPNFGAVMFENIKQTSPNHRREQDFVRFPSNERRQPTYVKFPSDEVNSIHNQDYKDRSPYRWNDYSSPSTSTKTIASNRQKQVRWRLPPSRSNNEYETSHQIDSLTGPQNKQKQKSSLLRFWPRMPLPDINFFATTSHGSHNEPIGGDHSSRLIANSSPTKTNYYSEVSSRDIDRLLAQTLRTPIGG